MRGRSWSASKGGLGLVYKRSGSKEFEPSHPDDVNEVSSEGHNVDDSNIAYTLD
jgi:hypothetical protein